MRDGIRSRVRTSKLYQWLHLPGGGDRAPHTCSTAAGRLPGFVVARPPGIFERFMSMPDRLLCEPVGELPCGVWPERRAGRDMRVTTRRA